MIKRSLEDILKNKVDYKSDNGFMNLIPLVFSYISVDNS